MFGLLFEQLDELTPPRIVDGARQTAIAHHADDVEVLHVDRLVVADQRQGLFVVEVPTRTGDLVVEDGDPAPCLRTVLAVPGSPGQGALSSDEPALRTHEVSRVGNVLSRTVGAGDRDETRDAQVDTRFPLGRRQRVRLDLHDERREVATVRFTDDRHRGRHGRQVTRPAHRHVADLRQEQPPAGAQAEPVACEPEGLPVVLAGLVPGLSHRAATALPGQRVEEVAVGAMRVLHGLHQCHRGHLGQPCSIFGGLGEGDHPPLHLSWRELPPRGAGVLTTADRVVEHHSRAPERTRQHRALNLGGLDPVAVPDQHDDHRSA